MEWILYCWKTAFIKDIFGPTDKNGIWMTDLIKALYLYQFTKVDNCCDYINVPILMETFIEFYRDKGTRCLQLILNGPWKKLLIPKLKIKNNTRRPFLI